MTTSEWSLAIAFVAVAGSLIATLVSFLTYVRAVSWQLPTVEFLAEHDESAPARHKLTVSNPTRRLLVLDYIEIRSPRPDRVRIQPTGLNLRGTVERAYEETSLPSERKKAVFLRVPPGTTGDLEIDVGTEEDFEVDFRLCWSKGIRGLERWFIVRKVKLSSAQVKSRTLAVAARPA